MGRTQTVFGIKTFCIVAALGVISLTIHEVVTKRQMLQEHSAFNTNDLVYGQMVNPRLSGTDEHNRLYAVRAETALKEDLSDTLIELQKVSGTVTLDNGRTLDIMAEGGNYLEDAASVDLAKNIIIKDSDGYKLNTKTLSVDLDKQQAISQETVSGQAPMGSIESEGLKIDGQNSTVSLTGKTKVTFDD